MTKSQNLTEPDVSKMPDTPSDFPDVAEAIHGANDMPDAGNIDKIRDILFGHQSRDYEKRFIRMEHQLTQEVAELKTEMLKRVDSLESYVKQELKDLNQRLKNEANERSDSHTMIERDLKNAFETLNKKLLQEEENLAEKSSELRDQILDQSKRLSEDLLAKFEQASSNLKTAAGELDDAKVNRSDLSGFFLDLAMRLSGDEGIAGK